MENPYRSPVEAGSETAADSLPSRLMHWFLLAILMIAIPFAIHAVFYPWDVVVIGRQNFILAFLMSGFLNAILMAYGIGRMNLSTLSEVLTITFYWCVAVAAVGLAQTYVPVFAETLASL